MLTDPTALVRELRNRPQVPRDEWLRPSIGLVANLIPQRDPFLFVDEIEHLDQKAQILVARYRVGADSPYFKGHFPGRPLFPGTLLIESMGQAGALLAALYTDENAEQSLPLLVRVHHALFLRPVLPGDTLALEATLLESDDLRAITAARVHRGLDLCAIAIMETHYVAP